MRRILLGVVIAVGLALSPLAVGAQQQAGKVYRIGYLRYYGCAEPVQFTELRQGLLNTSPIPVPGQNPIWGHTRPGWSTRPPAPLERAGSPHPGVLLSGQHGPLCDAPNERQV
jgi:hypothetical protein